MLFNKLILFLIFISPCILFAEGKKERKHLYKLSIENPQEFQSDEIQNNKERYKQIINNHIKKLKKQRIIENSGLIFFSTLTFISAARLLYIFQDNKQVSELELQFWTLLGTTFFFAALFDYLESTIESEIKKDQQVLSLLQ